MGVLRLGDRVFGPEQLVVMAVVAAEDAAAMERVHAVVAEGADAVEIGGGAGAAYAQADPRQEIRRIVPLVAAVREAHPGLVIGVSTGRAEVARAACAAGADLLTGSGSGLAGLAVVAAKAGAGLAVGPGAGREPGHRGARRVARRAGVPGRPGTGDSARAAHGLSHPRRHPARLCGPRAGLIPGA